MSRNESVRLKVSARVAALLRQEGREERLRAARGELPLSGEELLTALAFLVHGGDEELRKAALQTLKGLPRASVLPLVADAQLHPQLLDLVERVRGSDAALMEALVVNPGADAKTIARIASRAEGRLLDLIATGERAGEPEIAVVLSARAAAEVETEAQVGTADEDDEELFSEEGGEEEEEVDASKYRMALQMSVSVKIKTALTGDKEWRSIFLKDPNKLVSSAALKNPRITDGEVLAIAKNKSSSDELIRIITLNPEWVKNYEIQKALVLHPRTPLPKALRYMNVLTPKDLKHLAKSRGVSQVVVNNARRLLLAKDKNR